MQKHVTSTPRRFIVEQLGEKCVICSEDDIHLLQVDHKLGQGYLEKQYFKNEEEMWLYYIKNWKEEKDHLQILCSNCNLKKMRVNKEKGGPPLTALTDLLWIKSKDASQKTSEELEDSRKESEEREKKLKILLEKYPQFVPIKKRIDYLQERCVDFVYYADLYVNYTADALNFLPPPLNNILNDSLKKTNFDIHQIVKSRASSKWRMNLHSEDYRYEVFKDKS